MRYLVNRKTKEHVVYHDSYTSSANHFVVEADAEGWIKWAGGDCPLPGNARVDVRLDTGEILTGAQALAYYWHHGDDILSIVAYRPILDKPEAVNQSLTTEQRYGKAGGHVPAVEYDPRSVSFNVLKRLEAAHEAAQKIPDLEKELREVLGAMGYDLVARSPFADLTQEPLGVEFESALMNNLNKLYDDSPEPDMSDWRNWRPGDLVECITDSYGGSYKKGHIYEISNIFPDAINEIRTVEDEKGSKANGWAACYFRFHSRPEVKS